MRNVFRLYYHMVSISIRAQLQYRVNFVLFAIGNALGALIEYVGVWAMFDRFGALQGWSFAEVGVFFGIGNISFAICEAFTREFDVFYRHVRTGSFDRVLLRPRSTVLQMLGADVQIMRVGRLLQGTVILVISLSSLDLTWHFQHYFLLVTSIAGGAFLFSGIIVLQATSCFFTVESIEVWNSITYGGIQMMQYPLDIYKRPVRLFFTCIVPLVSINYWPCSYLLSRGYVAPWVSFVAPAAGVLVFLLSLLVWTVGVGHYRSTGS